MILRFYVLFLRSHLLLGAVSAQLVLHIYWNLAENVLLLMKRNSLDIPKRGHLWLKLTEFGSDISFAADF